MGFNSGFKGLIQNQKALTLASTF